MQTQKNIFYNVLLAVSQVLFPLITFPYLARVLGPEHLGLFNFADSYARYFALVAAMGISVYGVREIAKNQDNPEALTYVFVEIFLINFIATCLLSGFYLITIWQVQKLHIEQSLFYWSFIFFFVQVFVLEWFFTGINQFKFIALRFFVIRVCFIISVFYFIRESSDYLKYMQLQVALQILLGVINLRYLTKFLHLRNVKIKFISLKKHIKPLFILFLTLFSISIYLHFDTVILAMLSNNESVGYYSSSLKLVKIIIAVLAAISSAMIPKMVQIFNQGNELQFNKMVQLSFELIIHIGIPISFLVCLMAPEIIQILFGVNYQRSILPLQITSPLIIIVSLSTIFGFQILSVHTRDKYILKAAVSGMLVSLILSFILIPIYHEIGASITILLTEIVVLGSFIYASLQLVQLSNTRKLIYNEIIALLPYLLIVFCARYFKIDSVILKVLLILLFSLIWFLVLHFILFSTSTIKIQFNQVLMRYIKK